LLPEEAMPASATTLATAKKRKLRTNRNRDRLSVRLRFVIIGVRLCIPFAANEVRVGVANPGYN
jgi:hypothetical protein